MYKFFIKSLVALVMVFIANSIYAENIPDPNAAIVNQTIAPLMANQHIPGIAVELYVNGKPYAYYYGSANPAKNKPITKDTIFEIGSISKLMTALLFAQEIDYNKMSLSDKARNYLKDLPPSYEDISLQNLATHTAGLPFFAPADVQTPSQLMGYFSKEAPAYGTGEQWAYSNLGISLLAQALEASTKRDYNWLYRRHIVSPLGMHYIGLVIPDVLKSNYAQGFDKDGNPAPRVNLGIYGPAAGVKATAEDMQRFLEAAIGLPGSNARIFYPMRMTQVAYVKVPGYMQGLGWTIHQFSPESAYTLLHETDGNDFGPMPVQEMIARPVFYGDALIDKTGATAGFRSYIAVLPNKKAGIVILANKFVPKSVLVNAAREILFKTNKLI